MTKIQKPSQVEVWMRAWLTVAATENCRDRRVPSEWADRFLDDLERKFGNLPKWPEKEVSASDGQ